MLSEKAFKRLPEDAGGAAAPRQVRFATTEIRKVPGDDPVALPAFDLRRIDAALLVRHLGSICEREGVAVEPEALAMIARAAGARPRDSLSLLDQAIAHGAGRIDAGTVRGMLASPTGRASSTCFDRVVRGDVEGAMRELRDQTIPEPIRRSC